jgi:dTDP-4-amino-4,6-dideoxy-D-galactose acyltransferase
MTARLQLSPICDLLPWDSEFFHCRIGRVRGNTLNEGQAAMIDEWSRSERIDALYFLAAANCPETIRTAESQGFKLVDIRVTLECKSPGASNVADPQPPAGISIRPARSQDIPALETIARAAHADARFFSDQNFERARVEDFYATWIGLECRGRAQQVLVASANDERPIGYVSCHLDRKAGSGQIGLMAVGEQARGKGLGGALVAAALKWFGDQRAQVVTVVTQGKNIAAQRLYQNCGFLVRDLQLWYHKWFANTARNV